MKGPDRGEKGPLIPRTPTGRSIIRSTGARSCAKSLTISKVSLLLPSSRVPGDLYLCQRPPADLLRGPWKPFRRQEKSEQLKLEGSRLHNCLLTSTLRFQTWVSCVAFHSTWRNIKQVLRKVHELSCFFSMSTLCLCQSARVECRILSCLFGVAYVLFVFDVVVFCKCSAVPLFISIPPSTGTLTTDLLRVFPMFLGGGEVVTENRC